MSKASLPYDVKSKWLDSLSPEVKQRIVSILLDIKNQIQNSHYFLTDKKCPPYYYETFKQIKKSIPNYSRLSIVETEDIFYYTLSRDFASRPEELFGFEYLGDHRSGGEYVHTKNNYSFEHFVKTCETWFPITDSVSLEETRSTIYDLRVALDKFLFLWELNKNNKDVSTYIAHNLEDIHKELSRYLPKKKESSNGDK